MKYLALGKRLRHLREKRKLSLKALASSVGLTEDKLERIENDEEQPLIGHLIQFAKALEVNVAEFLRDRVPQKTFEVIRKREREKIKPLREVKNSKIFDYQYEFLTHPSEDKHLDAFLIELPPHQAKPPRDDMTHPGEEFIYLLEGRLEGEVDGEKFFLEPGDSLFLRSTQPHVFFNPGSVMARAITVIYPF